MDVLDFALLVDDDPHRDAIEMAIREHGIDFRLASPVWICISSNR
jgi:hypothetical protein